MVKLSYKLQGKGSNKVTIFYILGIIKDKNSFFNKEELTLVE